MRFMIFGVDINLQLQRAFWWGTQRGVFGQRGWYYSRGFGVLTFNATRWNA
ncbi:MAG: hypothetical protein ACREML_01910 [Vulcanimicrobiaceae bacterium]